MTRKLKKLMRQTTPNAEKAGTKTLIDNLIKLVVPKILTKLLSQYAFLSWGPLAFISKIIIEKALRFSLTNLSIFANSIFIRIEIKMDVGRMAEALVNAHANESPLLGEENVRANEEIRKALRNLIHIGRARL